MTNTTTNTTTMALVNAITDNKSFKGRKVSKDQVGEVCFATWRANLDELLELAYGVYETRYNSNESTSVDVSPVFSKMAEIFKLLGTLENGGVLRSDKDTAELIIAMSHKVGTQKSVDYAYEESKLRNLRGELRKATLPNGNAKSGQADHVKKVRADIDAQALVLKNLRGEADNVRAKKVRISNTTFYGLVEDYIADKLLGVLCKTNEEIKAEEEAKKEARKARHAKKTEKVENLTFEKGVDTTDPMKYHDEKQNEPKEEVA